LELTELISDSFSLPQSPTTVHPERIVDAGVVFGSQVEGVDKRFLPRRMSLACHRGESESQ
jgi:hypothetical protein